MMEYYLSLPFFGEVPLNLCLLQYVEKFPDHPLFDVFGKTVAEEAAWPRV